MENAAATPKTDHWRHQYTVAHPEDRARGSKAGVWGLLGAVRLAGVQGTESPLRVWGRSHPEAAVLLHSV